MKLTTPFAALKNATSDMWRIRDFQYKLPKEAKQDNWEVDFIDYPTSAHYKFDRIKNKF